MLKRIHNLLSLNYLAQLFVRVSKLAYVMVSMLFGLDLKIILVLNYAIHIHNSNACIGPVTLQ